ncbi:AfsA-related hotdog domain-containing protein [Actinocorallia populi]|uniref:AfsA-related hotdog domain-containing protein n=1 Tax=Actinocorallia populi TaxID=2079200 RepID=UPI000D094873|nr:AfsA-related hotdog domain-containing protein [Actinocorallia populi]
MTAVARLGEAQAEVPEATIGGEHAEPVPEALSALPRKRALFSVDGYFRDGWDDLLAVASDPWTLLDRHAMLLLTPAAVAGRRLEAALEWLLEQDAVVVAAEPVTLDRHSTRAMWWYRWNAATRRRRELTEALARAGDSLLLAVRLPEAPVPATLRLNDLKGPADPARREPWQLRHRLDDGGSPVDLVHTADEPADLVREFGILLDRRDRRRVYADLVAGADREAGTRALIEELYRRSPGHDLSRDRARRRRALGEPDEPWDSVVLGAAAADPAAPGGTALLPGVTAAQWEHAAARGPRPLRRERALPGPLVHKDGLGEVFLTDHVATGSGGFLMAGELPAAHRFYNDLPSARLDLLPVLELCRQGCYVVAHGHHGVPQDARFVLEELSGRLTADPEAVRDRRVRVEADVVRRSASAMALDYRVTAPDGTGLATARASFSWRDEAGWRGLRAAGRARHGLGGETGAPDRTGLFPSARNVGRTHDGNVVLADLAWRRGESTARVAADPANPAMFERPQDHVPDMVLLEAARQAALWTMSRHFGVPAGRLAVTGFTTRFAAMAELDVRLACTATVSADRGGKGAVAVRFVQDGVEPAEVMVEVVRA